MDLAEGDRLVSIATLLEPEDEPDTESGAGTEGSAGTNPRTDATGAPGEGTSGQAGSRPAYRASSFLVPTAANRTVTL